MLAVVAAGGAALLLDRDDQRLPSDFRRGVSLTGYSGHEYENDDAHGTPREPPSWAPTGSRSPPPGTSATPGGRTTSVPDGGGRPSPESVATSDPAGAEASASNVTLKPHLNTRDGTYRGEIEPRDVDRLVHACTRRMLRRTTRTWRSARARAELVVGTELEGVSGHSRRWRRADPRTSRKRFERRLTYAANYDEVFRIEFWDELDFDRGRRVLPAVEACRTERAELVEAWQKPLARLERPPQALGRGSAPHRDRLSERRIRRLAPRTRRRRPPGPRASRSVPSRRRSRRIAERPWIAGTDLVGVVEPQRRSSRRTTTSFAAQRQARRRRDPGVVRGIDSRSRWIRSSWHTRGPFARRS